MAHPQTPPRPESGLRERKRARTRRAIIEAAFTLFSERGFEAVRITDIAARAEVAPATVFTHFRTKEEIFFERGLAVNNGLAELVDAAGSAESLIHGLEEFFHRVVSKYLEGELLDKSRTWARILLESPALSDAHLVMDRERRRLLVAALTERARTDGRPTPSAEIEVLASMASAIASAAFRERHRQLAAGATGVTVVACVDDILRDGFGRLAIAYRSWPFGQN